MKCSEDLPACNNCVKHRVYCDYLNYSASQLEEIRRAHSAQQADHELAAEPADFVEATAAGDTIDAALDRVSDVSEEDTDAAIANTNAITDTLPRLYIDLNTFMDSLDNKPVELDLVGIAGDVPGQRPGHRLPQRLQPQHLQQLQHSNQPPHSIRRRLLLHPQLPGVLDDRDNFYNAGNDLTARVAGGVLDVLNFQASSVTQNFDNLLTEGEIIYPIYSIQNTPDTDERLQRLASADASRPFGIVRDVFLNTRTVTSDVSHRSPRALPNAQLMPNKIVVKAQVAHDYDILLLQKFAQLGEKIAHGKATLPEIRLLFRLWLCYFIHRAFTLEVMFLCLINLTTNYMITNAYLVPSTGKFDTLVAATRFRNILLVHLIQHYAVAIKQLLALLNENARPDLTSSISYILSLMSIYDPEATAYSTQCFRDGMFSVLIYALHQLKKSNTSPPPLIPIYLNLMTNMARTVYLPAYDETFLGEYQTMLTRFGVILRQIGAHRVVNPETWQFVQQEYGQLVLFCQKALTSYIPDVNNSLDDMKHQEDLFFHIFHTWMCVRPSRLLMVNRRSDPLEKILYLFSRLFRRVLFAVMPQMRFFYLRDLDSPLMLDVFTAHEDNEFFGELDDPVQLCVEPAVYETFKAELKTLAAYATRVLIFFKLRMAILYRNLVHNEKVRGLYPIRNVIEWRSTITDIKYTRDEFNQRIGLREYPIHSFNTTYIVPQHYPQIISQAGGETDFSSPNTVHGGMTVDLLSLKPHGLLAMDSVPGL